MSILEQIIANKREEISRSKAAVSIAELSALSISRPKTLNFEDAISRANAPAVIAEFKKASPSRGPIRLELDPVQTALSYKQAGASAISVLTDEKFFCGSLDYLCLIRESIPDIPLLRKDFIIDPYQIYETRASGADALLLIAAALDDQTLVELLSESYRINLGVLLEVHNEQEASRALQAFQLVREKHSAHNFHLPDSFVLGINNRDLHRFITDLNTTKNIIQYLRREAETVGFYETLKHTCVVAESGVNTVEDIKTLMEAGAHGLLIGESLVRSGDPGENLKILLGEFCSPTLYSKSAFLIND